MNTESCLTTQAESTSHRQLPLHTPKPNPLNAPLALRIICWRQALCRARPRGRHRPRHLLALCTQLQRRRLRTRSFVRLRGSKQRQYCGLQINKVTAIVRL